MHTTLLLMNDFWDFFSLALFTPYVTVNSLKCPSTLSLYAFYRRNFSDWIAIIKSKLLFLNKQLFISRSPSWFFKLIQLLERIWKKLWYIYQMRKYRSGTKSPITLNKLFFLMPKGNYSCKKNSAEWRSFLSSGRDYSMFQSTFFHCSSSPLYT